MMGKILNLLNDTKKSEFLGWNTVREPGLCHVEDA